LFGWDLSLSNYELTVTKRKIAKGDVSAIAAAVGVSFILGWKNVLVNEECLGFGFYFNFNCFG
jgi:hypothetical protein